MSYKRDSLNLGFKPQSNEQDNALEPNSRTSILGKFSGSSSFGVRRQKPNPYQPAPC